MSNKLTREVFDAHKSTLWARYSVDEYGKFSNQMERLWENIQSHTAECVAEAVAEAVKDRYRIGERVELQNGGNWHKAVVVAKNWGVNVMRIEPDHVRRPLVLREMTDDELAQQLEEKTIMVSSTLTQFSRSTLESMAHDLGIETKVPQ